ncbi:protein FAM78A-like [Clupea harengus]|uniref:Protein FAM78A-like n=1 Tax=Clupea harengus TaxID=7950 RepID=A0A6P3WE73_CLUHA|nr:protein FAM78A-like [Clupea harengus]
MGCVQSRGRCKPRFCDTITVLELNASIDPKPTTIDESSDVVLRYRTPHFRASAQVLVPPVLKREIWTVGWIQACNQMDFYNHYGNEGLSSWELPELRSGRVLALSDSDGVSYPWYGSTSEIYTIVGPTRRDTKLTVSMNDNFHPSVTWSVPIATLGSPAQLTGIRRDQRFTTWLVARNEASGETTLLRTVRWRMRLRIDVDPQRPLGQRARLLEPLLQDEPQVLAKNELIPANALDQPNANDAQMLMWRPSNTQPIMVIPPKHTHT